VQKPRFIKEINGLRVLAAFIVLAAHYSTISGLTSGISLFFVITGFLSGGKIKRAVAAGVKLNFWPDLRSTLWRLLLPMHIVLFVIAIWVVTSVDVVHRGDWLKSIFAMSLGYGNYYEISNASTYWERSSILSPSLSLWAMSVLVQFAFVLAAVRYVVSRVAVNMNQQNRNLALILFGFLAVFLGVLDALSFDGSTSYHFASTNWIWAFLLGLVLGGLNWQYGKTVLQIRIADALFFGLLLLGVMPIFGLEPLGTWVRPAFGLLAAICLLAPTKEDALFQKFLNNKYMQFVGGITFGIYLIHWPVMIVFRYYTDINRNSKVPQAILDNVRDNPNQITWYYAIALTIVSILLAWLMQKFADKLTSFVNKLKENKQIFTQGAVLVVVPMLVIVMQGSPISSNNESIENLVPPIEQALNDGPSYRFMDCQPGIVEVCSHGDINSETTIVIVGTSTAGQWYDALEATADQNNWHLLVMVKEGCTHPEDVYISFCENWRQTLSQMLTEKKPDLVIMETTHATLDQSHEEVIKSDEELLKSFQSAGIPVLGVRSTPRFPFFIPDCIASNDNFQEVCGIGATSFYYSDSEFGQKVNQDYFVEIADLTDVLCPDGFCSPVDNNILKYIDDKHFSATYAKSLAEELTPYVQRALANLN
jgi:peptidoglycan/LPS O-acetylase OafA/YrhL